MKLEKIRTLCKHRKECGTRHPEKVCETEQKGAASSAPTTGMEMARARRHPEQQKQSPRS
jgi:hypothetical protein